MPTPRSPHPNDTLVNDRAPAPKPPQNAPSPQADGTSEPLNKNDSRPDAGSPTGDEHLGATEGEVSETSPPAGAEYNDEPKQG